MLILSVNTSPLCSAEGGDSTIYKLLGLGILQGKLPYVDLFDNKGPYLYLINALGQWIIPGRWGLFILQSISLTTTLYFLYRTSCLFCNTKKSLLITVLSLFLLAGCYQGGNHVEEWMLPFLAIGFYLIIDLFKTHFENFPPKAVLWRSALWGLCFGIVLMLRPNDAIAFFGGILIGLCLWLLNKKEYLIALYAGLSFLAGAVVAIAPAIVWYASNRALSDMWFGMFGANSMVAEGLFGQLLTLRLWSKWAILLLMITLCVMLCSANQSNLLWPVIPICLFQLFFIGEKMYAHYFIPLFPLLVLYITMLFCQKNTAVLIIATATLCLSHRPLPRMAVLNISSSIKQVATKGINNDTNCPIPDDEKENVWNYSVDPWRPGVPLAWLIDHNILQCNRRTGSLDTYVKEKNFQSTNPLWVVSYGNEFERDQSSLDYLLLDSISSTDYSIYFYRKASAPCLK